MPKTLDQLKEFDPDISQTLCVEEGDLSRKFIAGNPNSNPWQFANDAKSLVQLDRLILNRIRNISVNKLDK